MLGNGGAVKVGHVAPYDVFEITMQLGPYSFEFRFPPRGQMITPGGGAGPPATGIALQSNNFSNWPLSSILQGPKVKVTGIDVGKPTPPAPPLPLFCPCPCPLKLEICTLLGALALPSPCVCGLVIAQFEKLLQLLVFAWVCVFRTYLAYAEFATPPDVKGIPDINTKTIANIETETYAPFIVLP